MIAHREHVREMMLHDRLSKHDADRFVSFSESFFTRIKSRRKLLRRKLQIAWAALYPWLFALLVLIVGLLAHTGGSPQSWRSDICGYGRIVGSFFRIFEKGNRWWRYFDTNLLYYHPILDA